VKLDESGRPIFVDLMRRRGPFQFVAFDVLALNGKGVRQLDSRIARACSGPSCRSVRGRSSARSTSAVAAGISSRKPATRTSRGSSRSGSAYDLSSPLALWAKIKNPDYSQARDRHKLFERA
jgi:hypothetical protein